MIISLKSNFTVVETGPKTAGTNCYCTDICTYYVKLKILFKIFITILSLTDKAIVIQK